MTNPRKSYKTIQTCCQFEIAPIKGSRFIGYASPIKDEVAAKKYLEQIAQKHHSANHCCFAYTLKENQKTKFSDAGEPSNSAGKPILAPILGQDLLDIIVIVVRYFGGTELGIGGLVRAYSKASNAVIAQSTIIEKKPQTQITFYFDYQDTQKIQAALSQLEIMNQSSHYDQQVKQTLVVLDSHVQITKNLIYDYSSGKVHQFSERPL